MNSFNMQKQGRAIIALISLLSMSFLASAPFERNPQGCGMINTLEKKKKNSWDKKVL